jgi:hypothetical protein
VDQHHADHLVAAGDEEGGPVGRGRVPPEAGVEPGDVGAVDPHRVREKVIGDAHPHDLVLALVVPGREKAVQVHDVDDGEHHVEPHHRPHVQRAVVADENEAADQVEGAQPQDRGLQQRPDQQRRPGPADDLQPVHTAHDARLTATRRS